MRVSSDRLSRVTLVALTLLVRASLVQGVARAGDPSRSADARGDRTRSTRDG